MNKIKVTSLVLTTFFVSIISYAKLNSEDTKLLEKVKGVFSE